MLTRCICWLVGCFGSLSLCVSKSREREREKKRQEGTAGS
jgi:hypothetical protein